MRSTPIADRVDAVLEQIAARNPSLNAFITVLDASARAQARVLDRELREGRTRGPLHGQPISVKDLIDVQGVPTTAASRVRAGHVAETDAPLVARLRDAGAIIIGKTNLHEFALGTLTDESAFGPSRNPHDTTRSPGGSSGGSAAAVAAGLGWASIGSDTGGSIRIPAAACGIVGLKPTFGEIPTVGLVPLSPSLDHVGPLAGSVADAWHVYAALAGGAAPPDHPAPVGTLRLGHLGGYFVEKLEADVRLRFEEALQRLAKADVALRRVEMASAAAIPRTYIHVVLPEAAGYHARTLESAAAAYSPGVRARLELGKEISRDDYVAAQSFRNVLRQEVDAALSEVDALVLPTLPLQAPAIGATTIVLEGVEEPLRPLTLRLTQLFNLTGHPAISLPCGTTADGMPCGLQLVGRRHQTTRLLEAALSSEPVLRAR